MELVLVRHGEPEWVRDGYNVDDPPLTPRGQDQAARLAERLADETFDEVYVSPLVRARQTAAPLLARIGRPEVVEDWLEEIRNPVWHGTPAERAAEAYAADRARPAHERWDGLEGGEPVRDFVARIRLGAQLFLAERGIEPAREDLPVWTLREPERRILFVAHAGTNTIVICHLLGLVPVPWEWDRFILGHASVTPRGGDADRRGLRLRPVPPVRRGAPPRGPAHGLTGAQGAEAARGRVVARGADALERLGQVHQLLVVQSVDEVAAHGRDVVRRGLLQPLTTSGREHGVDGPAVGRARLPDHQPLPHQQVETAGEAARRQVQVPRQLRHAQALVRLPRTARPAPRTPPATGRGRPPARSPARP